MTRCLGLLAVAAVFCASPLAAAGDDLPNVEKKIIEAWSKHKSVRARLTATTHAVNGIFVTDGKGEGTFEFVRKDGKLYSRMELTSKLVRQTGDNKKEFGQRMLVVVDGEFAYTFSEFGGRKTARKTSIGPKMTGDPKALFAQQRETHALRLLPEQTVDGHKTYVIEAAPKGGSALRKTVFFFRQDIGLMVRMVMYDQTGTPMTTMTYSDIKLNTDIKPERFVFEAPEGVTVIDLTGPKP